jgi:tetratricopeptide (TPR) repeat protein
LFGAALLTKSVTATLPAALLVVCWWRRGTLAWRRDALPLIPWLAAGALAGLFTAWVERTYIGAAGGEFALSLAERMLLATRAIAFYASKLLWPVNLTFTYPRWTITAGDIAPWLAFGAVVGLTLLLWSTRRRTRAPLAGWLFFVGSLFPVLGFFNIYPFIFSYVADHWQYLPSLGLIVSAAAGIVRLTSDPEQRVRAGGRLAIGASLAVLAGLTFTQSRNYRDGETLYRATLARNPEAWMAHNNLGALLTESGRPADALPHLAAALRLRPGHLETRANLGGALVKLGRLAEAAPHLEAAMRSASLRRRPGFAALQANWAALLLQAGRAGEALPLLESALRLRPEVRETRNLLGWALAHQGRLAEALDTFAAVSRQHPDFADPRLSAGYWLARAERIAEAIAEYEAGLKLAPQTAAAERDLARLLLRAGRVEEAASRLERVVRTLPDSAEAHRLLADALMQTGRLEEAIARFEVGLRLSPGDVDARVEMAGALARVGRRAEAAAQCEEVLRHAPEHAAAKQQLAELRAGKEPPAERK